MNEKIRKTIKIANFFCFSMVCFTFPVENSNKMYLILLVFIQLISVQNTKCLRIGIQRNWTRITKNIVLYCRRAATKWNWYRMFRSQKSEWMECVLCAVGGRERATANASTFVQKKATTKYVDSNNSLCFCVACLACIFPWIKEKGQQNYLEREKK